MIPKSGVTMLLDVIRNVLILIATGFLVFLIWKWHWIAAVLVAILVYIVMMNLVGFLTLPLYMLTPENKLKAKAFRAFQAGDIEQGKALTDEFTESSTSTSQKDADEAWLRGYTAFKEGKEHFAARREQEALACFDTAVEAGYLVPELFSVRGSCLQALEWHYDAIDDFTQAISLEPQDCNSYFERAMSKSLTGDEEGFLADVQEAIRLAKHDNALTRNYNEGAREMGHRDAAAIYEAKILGGSMPDFLRVKYAERAKIKGRRRKHP